MGGATTDATDASAVTYHSNEVDIFSNSWGPPDHGFVVAGPQRLTLMAIRQGAMTVSIQKYNRSTRTCTLHNMYVLVYKRAPLNIKSCKLEECTCTCTYINV